MSTPMLDVTDVRSGYGAVEILRGVSMQLRAGELVALLGSNGAGKTTLNNVLSGVLPAWAGQVHFDGQLLTGQSYTQVVRSGLIHVPEGRKIFPNLSVLENLQLGVQASRRFADGTVAPQWSLEQIFALFPNLADMQQRPASHMSGGEQQMLTVARTLMGNPLMVLLDEPSEGVAPVIVEQMGEMILALKRQGVSVLLSEQNTHFAQWVSDRSYTLDRGVLSA